ncbi:hypothetical protein P10VF_109 [Rhizobium phage vB_RleM_P10VF]|uniref:Uncharacterized protein n=1 Tax=Rhizobium phage vB_RleM_P10VF TaxID=1527770 RepID=A0A076YKL4_9CAUD|nr:hypothetical protein P10VF_109 [Rhizobium phage vB_RleM_P10VF]AIK68322.1 hypothetical protein P10VF_109 [Rhizobium phage vB_RleM_P10VF]
MSTPYHFKDKLGNNLSDNEVFVHEDGKCYALMGSGMTSKEKSIQKPTMFVNAEAQIVWKLSSEMTPFTL